MAKRGRKPKATVARAAAPNLSLRALRAGRQSAGNRTPIHFKHVAFKRDERAAKGLRKRQNYIERDGAAETLDLTDLDKANLAQSAEKFVDADPTAFDPARASFGTLGQTPEERRSFWAVVDQIERKNARTQYGIIAELPHEVSPAGRLKIVRTFAEDQLEARHLPYWAVTHRPDAHNDPRNYHCHILYYARPGTRTADGWSFTNSPTQNTNAAPSPLVAGQYPWGTERPNDRIRRAEKQLRGAKDPEKIARYEAMIAEAKAIAEAVATRAPQARGGPENKSRRTYPWGQEAPGTRKKRFEDQIQKNPGSRKIPKWKTAIEEVDAFLASPEVHSRIVDATTPVLNAKVDDKDWVISIKDAWCRACNQVLEEEGHPKRYHPGGYKDLGIAAEPTKHLGTKASALEAQGFMTAAGRDNTERALRNLLTAGVDIDTAAAEAARQTIERRKAWATMEAEAARQAGRPDRVAHWEAEAATAEQVADAIQERLQAPEPEPARIILADRLREVLHLRSALPDEEPIAPSPAVEVREAPSGLAALLAARLAPEAASYEDPFAPAQTPEPVSITAPATTGPSSSPSETSETAPSAPPVPAATQETPAAPETPTAAAPQPAPTPLHPPAGPQQPADQTPPAASSAPSPAPDADQNQAAPSPTPVVQHATRADTVAAVADRADRVQQQIATQDTSRAIRVRPDASNEERAAVRNILVAKPHEALRRNGRHTRAALERPRDNYDRATLQAGLEVVTEAIAITTAARRGPEVARKIGLDGAVRHLRTAANAVIRTANHLADAIPGIRRRVAQLSDERQQPEIAIAPEGAKAYRHIRDRDPAAAKAAADIEAAMTRLESAWNLARTEARIHKGFTQPHRAQLSMLKTATSKATGWIPPEPGNPLTIERRARDLLTPSSLPAGHEFLSSLVNDQKAFQDMNDRRLLDEQQERDSAAEQASLDGRNQSR